MHRLGTMLRLPRAGGAALLAVTALLALALAMVTPAAPARANGTPIRIVLSYLNGISNFGPRNATGVAELITSEGEVRLTAAGLQKPGPDEEYQLWISSTEASQRMRLGTLQVTDAGVGRLDTVLRQPIPELPWDQMTITVEAKGYSGTTPSERRAIAGRFSIAQPNGPGPRVLPNTGGADATAGLPSTGLFGLGNGGTLLFALLVVGGLGFALGRVGARRELLKKGADR
jgi:Anti-sigma-K factor rskA, C-terminal